MADVKQMMTIYCDDNVAITTNCMDLGDDQVAITTHCMDLGDDQVAITDVGLYVSKSKCFLELALI